LLVSACDRGYLLSGAAKPKSLAAFPLKTLDSKVRTHIQRVESDFQIMKSFVCTLIVALLLSSPAAFAHKVEFSGGYAHITGNQGLDGFNVGVAAWFTRRVALAADYGDTLLFVNGTERPRLPALR
jgi:hypothetical protein